MTVSKEKIFEPIDRFAPTTTFAEARERVRRAMVSQNGYEMSQAAEATESYQKKCVRDVKKASEAYQGRFGRAIAEFALVAGLVAGTVGAYDKEAPVVAAILGVGAVAAGVQTRKTIGQMFTTYGILQAAKEARQKATTLQKAFELKRQEWKLVENGRANNFEPTQPMEYPDSQPPRPTPTGPSLSDRTVYRWEGAVP